MPNLSTNPLLNNNFCKQPTIVTLCEQDNRADRYRRIILFILVETRTRLVNDNPTKEFQGTRKQLSNFWRLTRII